MWYVWHYSKNDKKEKHCNISELSASPKIGGKNKNEKEITVLIICNSRYCLKPHANGILNWPPAVKSQVKMLFASVLKMQLVFMWEILLEEASLRTSPIWHGWHHWSVHFVKHLVFIWHSCCQRRRWVVLQSKNYEVNILF